MNLSTCARGLASRHDLFHGTVSVRGMPMQTDPVFQQSPRALALLPLEMEARGQSSPVAVAVLACIRRRRGSATAQPWQRATAATGGKLAGHDPGCWATVSARATWGDGKDVPTCTARLRYGLIWARAPAYPAILATDRGSPREPGDEVARVGGGFRSAVRSLHLKWN